MGKLNHYYLDDAICVASEYGDIEAVEHYLKKGADVNAWDHRPLFWASQNGNLNIVELLIKNGSYVTNESISEAREAGHKEVVKLLENHRAKGTEKKHKKMDIDSIEGAVFGPYNDNFFDLLRKLTKALSEKDEEEILGAINVIKEQMAEINKMAKGEENE